MIAQKITPFLWFDNQAEEAANFYVSVFPDSRIVNMSRYTEGGPGPAGQVLVAVFELEGQRFQALNGGDMFKFTEAVSFLVNCTGQEEVDFYWDKLCEGGQPSRCGWLKDKFGLSWQIIPSELGQLLSSGDSGKAGRVMQAMMKMSKIDISLLEAAANNE